jgi:hypothetical protein
MGIIITSLCCALLWLALRDPESLISHFSSILDDGGFCILFATNEANHIFLLSSQYAQSLPHQRIIFISLASM